MDVYKPSGELLLRFRHRVPYLPKDVCELARPALRKAGAGHNNHRGFCSGMIGYYDCRVTRFTANHRDDWGRCLPFIRACDRAYQHYLPSHHFRQRKLSLESNPKWIIADTAFTTGTANTWDARHDGRSHLHKDDGDFPRGFGVISALSRGSYTGGYLVFPEYLVAVDLRTTDLMMYDTHEYHGNAPIDGEPGWERVACILYYQTRIQHCPKGG